MLQVLWLERKKPSWGAGRLRSSAISVSIDPLSWVLIRYLDFLVWGSCLANYIFAAIKLLYERISCGRSGAGTTLPRIYDSCTRR